MMKKMKMVLGVLLLCMLISGCGNDEYGIAGVGEPKMESTVLKARTVDLGYEDENLTFTFTDNQYNTYSNIDMKRNYKVVIDDSLLEPEIEYEVFYLSGLYDKEEIKNVEWGNTENDLVIIKMSSKDYYNLTGKAAK